MTRALDDREEHRKSALTEFLDARVREGYSVETRTDTHAIIAPAHRRRSFFDLLRKPAVPARQVVSVDSDGEVSMRPAEPVRS
jgi:hypothetical protein